MFCSDCGKEASGKFCWSCGHALKQLANGPLSVEPTETVTVPVDWSNLIDCQTLLAIAEVRDHIAKHAAQSKKKISGEEFLKVCDKFAGVLTGGVPLTFIAKISQPISERLGLKTGKVRREQITQPPGNVIVGLLCSLAQNGQNLRDIQQLTNGCTIHAALPSDVWSFEGDLVLTVLVENTATIVEASTTIHGALYDWGKSNRALDRLFADVNQLARAA